MNGAAGFAILMLEGLALLVAFAAWMFARRLRRPPRRVYASAVSRGEPGDPSEADPPRKFESWSLSCGGVECGVWEIVGDDPAGPVIIATPGWGDSRIGVLTRLAGLAPAASRILAWDPPGHGDSRGLCALGTREHEGIIGLARRSGSSDFVLYGWSLGGGVSVVAGSMLPVRAVIAEAPYCLPWTPAFRVMHLAAYPWRVNGPIAFACLGARLGVGPRWRGFDRALHAAKLGCPLLVLHGTDDEVCPIEDGRAIARAVKQGEIVEIAGGRHNDLWTEQREESLRALKGFLERTQRRAE